MKKTKIILIAILVIIATLAITYLTVGDKIADWLWVTFTDHKQEEGMGYAKMEGNTMVITATAGWGKVRMDSCDVDEMYDSARRVEIRDEIKPTSIDCWFSNMPKVKTISGLEKLDVSEITSMFYVFSYSPKLESIDGISQWDTRSLTSICGLFTDCDCLTTIDLSGWDTRNLNSTYRAFYHSSLVEIRGLENWNVENLEYTGEMFAYCKDLQYIGNLDSWNLPSNANTFQAFIGCDSLGYRPDWAN